MNVQWKRCGRGWHLWGALALSGCADNGSDIQADDAVVFAADVKAITSTSEAQSGVFIPPFEDCREPLEGEAGDGPGGKVCTNVAISGCTEPGKNFKDYASCEVVRTQRPFYPTPPAKVPSADDPRAKDTKYMAELDWVKAQVSACGCVCCHDGNISGGVAGQWDVSMGPVWLDTLSDSGLALFTGLADSSVLGAYPAKDNHGFDRMITGLPSNDSARLKKFMLAELERRGISEAKAATTPPFGGPIYANRVAVPGKCASNEGVSMDGSVHWKGGYARYVYVLEDNTENPGVPPNLDVPEGTLWKLDVLASEDGLESGIKYGTTPAGSFQALPESESAPGLKEGTKYHLHALLDVGLPISNCIFTYGDDISELTTPQDAGTATACDGGDGFGTACSTDDDCGCDASYCALQPGASAGYCTRTGCKENSSVCPEGSSCVDLSVFSPGLPSICTQPQ